MKCERKNIDKAGELLYLFGTVLYFSYYMYYFGYYWRMKNFQGEVFHPQKIFYLAIIIFCVKILITIRKYHKFEIVFGIVVSIILYNCWRTSGTIDFLVNFLLIFAFKDVEMRKVMKVACITGFVFFVFGITKIFLDNPTLISVTKDYGRGGVETRYQFCAWHPNIMHLIFSAFITIFLFVYYRSCKWWGYLCLFFFNYELFLLTRSRTGFLTGCIAICLYFILRYLPRIFKNKISFFIFEIINLGAIAGSMYFGFYASTTSKLYITINKMITGRFDILKYFIQEDGIHLFGSSLGGRLDGWGLFKKTGQGYVTELGFPRLILEYGPIIFTVICLMIFCTTWILYRNEKYAELVFLAVCIFSFTVDALYPASWNPMPFVLGYGIFGSGVLWRKNHKNKDKKVNLET